MEKINKSMGLVVEGGIESVKNILALYDQGLPISHRVKKINPYLSSFFEKIDDENKKNQFKNYADFWDWDQEFPKSSNLCHKRIRIRSIDPVENTFFLDIGDTESENRLLRKYFNLKGIFSEAEIKIPLPKKKEFRINFEELLFKNSGEPFPNFTMKNVVSNLLPDNIIERNHQIHTFNDGVRMSLFLMGCGPHKEINKNTVLFDNLFLTSGLFNPEFIKKEEDKNYKNRFLSDFSNILINFRLKEENNSSIAYFNYKNIKTQFAIGLRDLFFRRLKGKKIFS